MKEFVEPGEGKLLVTELLGTNALHYRPFETKMDEQVLTTLQGVAIGSSYYLEPTSIVGGPKGQISKAIDSILERESETQKNSKFEDAEPKARPALFRVAGGS